MNIIKLLPLSAASVILLVGCATLVLQEPAEQPAPTQTSETSQVNLSEPHYATPAVPCYGIQTAPDYEVSVVMAQPLEEPTDLAFAPDGSLYSVGCNSYSIKKVSPDGTVSTFTELHNPASTIAYSSNGELFVGGRDGIWKVFPDGKVSLFSKAPTSAMVFATDGSLYSTERTYNYPNTGAIWKINPDGEYSTFNTELYWPDDIEVSPLG